MKKPAMRRTAGRVFHAEEIARAKALRQEPASQGQGTEEMSAIGIE